MTLGKLILQLRFQMSGSHELFMATKEDVPGVSLTGSKPVTQQLVTGSEAGSALERKSGNAFSDRFALHATGKLNTGKIAEHAEHLQEFFYEHHLND